MNVLNGKISSTESKGNFSSITCAFNKQTIHALVIGNESSMEYLTENKLIDLLINESEIIIAKNLTGLISISNQLSCEIISIQKGSLFSRIKLNFEGQELYSLSSTFSCQNLNLQPGDNVTVLIKANEIFLKQKEVPA